MLYLTEDPWVVYIQIGILADSKVRQTHIFEFIKP